MVNQPVVPSAVAGQEFAQKMLEWNIVSLGGPLCTVSLSAGASLHELREAIERHAGVPRQGQRLYHALQELRVDADLASLPGGEAARELSLVRRPVEQARWLQELDEAHSAFDWMAGAEEDALADKEVVLMAVARDGRTFQFAAPELRADRQVAIAAVARSWLAFEHTSPELQADDEVAHAATTRDWGAVRYAAREPREELDLDSQFFMSSGILILFLFALLSKRWAASAVLAASLGFVHFVYEPREDMTIEAQYYSCIGLACALLVCLAAVDDGKFWFWVAQVIGAIGAGIWFMLSSREWFLLSPRVHACFRGLGCFLRCEAAQATQQQDACCKSIVEASCKSTEGRGEPIAMAPSC